MKILWHSTNPLGMSGYCGQTAKFAPLLNQLGGIEVVMSAYTYRGSIIQYRGVDVLQSPGSDFGSSFARHHYAYNGCDIVLSLTDPFALSERAFKEMRWAAWVPVDSEPAKSNNIDILQHADWIIAMSQFGYNELLKYFDPEKVFYVPHGIDTKEEYFPEPREKAREEINRLWKRPGHDFDIGDKFVVTSIMANVGRPSRKNFAALIEAWARFTREVTDQAILYIHTNADGSHNGESLNGWAEQFNVIENTVVFPDPYMYEVGRYNPANLRLMLSASDVYVQSSRGEGFGIPIIEAQACATPVIVTGGTAMTELAQEGWVVRSSPNAYYPGSFNFNINVNDLFNHLRRAYNDHKKPVWNERRDKARKFAMQYDQQVVLEKYWAPVMNAISRDVMKMKAIETA